VKVTVSIAVGVRILDVSHNYVYDILLLHVSFCEKPSGSVKKIHKERLFICNPL
jgi:hypothetical protein